MATEIEKKIRSLAKSLSLQGPDEFPFGYYLAQAKEMILKDPERFRYL